MTKTDAAVLYENAVKPTHGTHCIGDLVSDRIDLLSDFSSFREFIDKQIQLHNLSKVGEVYHHFPGGGFTAVVCLSESHLSIHTWPERNYFTFDVFLSNFKRDNREITLSLFKDTISFFEAVAKSETILDR
jgi:S-adenosylmethionine decarboxylase